MVSPLGQGKAICLSVREYSRKEMNTWKGFLPKAKCDVTWVLCCKATHGQAVLPRHKGPGVHT